MPHEPALQSRGGTSHAMGSGCMDIITLLKYHCLLCVHIALLLDLSDVSRFAPGDRPTS